MEFESLSIIPIKTTSVTPDAYRVSIQYKDKHGFSSIQEREYRPAPVDIEAMLVDIHEHVIETLKISKNGSNNKSNGAGVPADAQTAKSSDS